MRIAYVTDRGLLGPTLLSLDSALARTTCEVDVEVVFVGLGLSPVEADGAARVVAAHPGARLDWRALDPAWLAEGRSPKAFITPTALGRMFLPRLVEGRVLYLDGDTLVRRSLAPLARLHLAGHPLAAVPDYVTLRRLADGRLDRLGTEARVVGAAPLWSYVNSGVLLLDPEAICALPGCVAALEDLKAAAGFPTVDQDRINQVFAGRTMLLDPAWNASWGRDARQRADLARVGACPLAAADGLGPAILHFHGPHKPWKAPRMAHLTRGPRALWTYRRALRAFRRRFPDLAP